MSKPASTNNQDRTKSTYALQWNRFRIIRPEEDRTTFANRTGFTPEELRGKQVLDAGCGMGRYLKVVREQGAIAFGIDLSWSVQAVRDTTGTACAVRGDLFHPPFIEGGFDFIYSIGVLDHTPDPRSAFLAAAKRLKPGGRIAIWVYQKQRPALETIMNIHRAVSTKLPLGLLVFLSRIMSPIGALKRKWLFSPNRLVSKAGVALNLLTIGVSMHPDPEVRVCDTLDWYAPQYASRHTLEEVQEWFNAAGLVDVVDLSKSQTFFHKGQGNGINLCGRRPG